MPNIQIDKAEPGMVVTEEVVNDKGMVLLPPGTKLTEALLNRLKKWNVQNVTCDSAENAEGAGKKEVYKKPVMDSELEKKLTLKFEPLMNDPIMKEIYNALKIFYQDTAEENNE